MSRFGGGSASAGTCITAASPEQNDPLAVLLTEIYPIRVALAAGCWEFLMIRDDGVVAAAVASEEKVATQLALCVQTLVRKNEREYKLQDG
jgi:hypothetical protein